MAERYDLVVVGTGAGASHATHACAAAGWEVAVVDGRPYGGTCALRGCDPKKVLVTAAMAADDARRHAGHGLQGSVSLDWPALHAFQRTFTDPVPASKEEGLRAAGITTLHGTARFTSPSSLAVGERTLEAGHVLLAVGARPVPLGIPGEDHVSTSTDFLALERLPERIAFIGGGYVSFEFAHVAARAGAEVHILHRSARPLGHFDPDLVEGLVQHTRALGVRVELEAAVQAVERTGQGLLVKGTRHGTPFAVEADLVVHGAGRAPDLAPLDLPKGEVAATKRGITVDAHLRSTTNPRVYAAGDCAATEGPPLTPIAAHHSRIVAANLLGEGPAQPDHRAVPSVVFTIPPLAMVGLREDQATEQGLRFRAQLHDTAGWQNARRAREPAALAKVLVEEGTGRILGAHLLGPHVDEAINVLALAMRHGIPAEALKAMPWSYPTATSELPYVL
jgi:glutathione reductase (NADPH)